MKRSIPIPKDSAGWFRARARYPAIFNFTADGNLQVPEIRDTPSSVIEIPPYRRATIDELAELTETRGGQISAIEEEFDATMDEFIGSLEAFRETGIGSDVIRLQRKLATLDNQKSVLRSPLRWIQEIPDPVKRTIFPDLHYEVRHLGHEVYKLSTRKFTFEELVREGVEEFEGAEAEDEAGEGDGEGEGEKEESFVLFYGPEDDTTGFLSPEFPVEFVFNSVRYTSAVQAYEVERTVGLGRKDVKTLLLKTRSIKTIRTIAAGIKGLPPNPQQLWTDIYAAIMAQHEELAKQLLATGSDRLVYCSPLDTDAGIGLPIEDPSVLDKTAWKGTNWLGAAIEAVRTQLKLTASDEAAVAAAGDMSGGGSGGATGGGFTESAKTKEDEQKERAAVVQGYYRHRKAGGGAGARH
jgi:ribA/ribD-fused uncharacterized protein